jgi:Ca-activated chloride channel homolog
MRGDIRPRIVPLAEQENRSGGSREAGLGTLATERGNLPLERVDAAVLITGLVSRIELTQGFHNPHDVPLEATYIFPLPDRAALTALTMTADDRTVEAALQERGAAREAYDQALAEGRRAAIAEEERPDVFTMRVGNILPGERVSVAMTLDGPLSYEDGEATFRLPLVVAPRYIPGEPSGTAVGDGYALDTDAVPDASRITPPVLLPGFPNPVRLTIAVDIDPGGLPLPEIRSSLPTVEGDDGHLEVRPGERLDRDFVLRLPYGEADRATHALTMTADAEGEEGTFRLTLLPPTSAAPPRPRDVVLLLDRSGSMGGWKMVAARRAAARIVDTLTAADRFAVLAFDDRVERPTGLGSGLTTANDANRFTAVGYLSTVDARGGTELLAPLVEGLGLLTDDGRDRVLVLVTDGQVGNEDHILREVTPKVARLRVHTVGIDQAVNAGFLGRLAAVGGGRCELVESADRLDDAMAHIHRRIGAPSVTGLTLDPDSGGVVADTVSPARLPDLFPGAPLVVTGRYRGTPPARVRVAGRTREGTAWRAEVPAEPVAEPTLTSLWARAHLRDLEDQYASTMDDHAALERRIVTTSLRFGVLCRFTAWVAVDERVVAEGGERHRVIQPVEPAAGWDMLAGPPAPAPAMTMAAYMPPPVAGARSGLQRFAKAPKAGSTAAGGFAGGAPALMRAMSVPGADDTEAVRQLVQAELSRLRDGVGAADVERRELLGDLGSRLEALARELERSGAAAELVAEVRALAEALTADDLAAGPADLDGLWRRAEELLERLAAGPAAGGKEANAVGDGDGPGKPRPRPFWKR